MLEFIAAMVIMSGLCLAVFWFTPFFIGFSCARDTNNNSYRNYWKNWYMSSGHEMGYRLGSRIPRKKPKLTIEEVVKLNKERYGRND